MTIQEFFYKYRDNGLSGRNIEVVYNDELEIDNITLYQNIIFNDIPQDPAKRAEIIYDIFTKSKPGISIYIDDYSNDFVELLQQKFSSDNKLTEEKHYGVSIQHIYDVGYIVSLTKCHPLFIINDYTLDEYDELSNEYIVLGIAKNEKHYVKDWVAYHLHIGFDRIYLFDNNTDPDETYDEILSEYIKDGRVQLVNFRDKKSIQNSLYNSFYYNVPFKWLAVIDIDEFIWFDETYKCNNIKDFLQDKCEDPDRFGIMLQWHCYAASGDDKPSDRPIWEANNKLLPFNVRKNCRPEYIHNWCKSIYKRGYRLTLNEHFAWEEDSRLDSPNIYIKENDYNDKPIVKNNLLYIQEDEFNSQGVYVKHFLLRNIDDFYFHKYLRGHAGGDFEAGSDGWKFWYWNQNLNYFTDISCHLTEKEQIYLEKHGMKVNYTFHPDIFINWYKLEGNDYINSVITDILCKSFLPNANCMLTQYDIADINKIHLDADEIMKERSKNNYDFNFLSRSVNNHYYFDITMGGEREVIRKNIQDPIVINIGIPIKYAVDPVSIEEQKQYAEFLSIVFNEHNVKQYLRAAIDYNTTTIPNICVMKNSENCMGYKDGLEEFLKDLGLRIPSKALISNTMIMPFSQYIKLCEFQNKFVKQYGWFSNKEIYDNLVGNYNTPYHAYICSVMSVIENPYFVWPA